MSVRSRVSLKTGKRLDATRLGALDSRVITREYAGQEGQLPVVRTAVLSQCVDWSSADTVILGWLPPGWGGGGGRGGGRHPPWKAGRDVSPGFLAQKSPGDSGNGAATGRIVQCRLPHNVREISCH